MVLRILNRFTNVLLVIGAVSVGVFVPHFGSYVDPLITPLVIFLVFTSLQGVQLAEIEFSSYAVLIILSLCISYVVLPAGGMQLVESVLADDARLGFAIALSVPTTAGSAIIWTRLARGDVQLAATISIVSLVVAPVVTPIVLTQLVGSQITVPIVSILLDLLIIVGGGVLLTVGIPSGSIPPRIIENGSTGAILLLIYAGVAGVEVSEITGWNFLSILSVSVLLFGFGLVISTLCEHGFSIARVRTLPLFFTANLKNLGIALLISFPFSEPLVTISIITYYVVQQLGGALLADITT